MVSKKKTTSGEIAPQHSIPVQGVRVGVIAIAVSAVTLVLYLLTMSSTFGFVDDGELAAAAVTFGIPHPTGYPVMMLVGYLFNAIIPGRDVLVLNVLACIIAAMGAGILVLLYHRIWGMIGGAKKEKKRGINADALYAGAAALVTAFAATWWNQGNGFEVYALHALMLPLLLVAFFKFMQSEGEVHAKAAGITHAATLFGLVLGLSFSNHLTTLLAAPALLFYYFAVRGLQGQSWKRLLYVVPGVILGLLPYLLLFIRAGMDPALNWGNPSSIGRFMAHVTGAQYRIWMFTGGDVFAQQTAYFFGKIPGEFAYAGLFAALLGVVQLFRKNTKLGLFVVLLFVTSIAYAGTFAIKEIEPYFMTAVLALGLCVVAGLHWLAEIIGRGALAVAVALAVACGVLNYSVADQSGATIAEDIAYNVLNTVPENAVVLSTRWDAWVSGSIYLQQIEGVRPDVVVINPNALHGLPYLEHLQARHPELFVGLEKEVTDFRKQAERFQEQGDGLYRETQTYSRAFYGMLNALVGRVALKRAVCVTAEVDKRVGAGLTRTPYQLVYRLTPGNAYLSQVFPKYRFNNYGVNADIDALKVYEMYASSLVERGKYEARFGLDSLAGAYGAYAVSFDPQLAEDDIPVMPLSNRATALEILANFKRLHAGLVGGITQ